MAMLMVVLTACGTSGKERWSVSASAADDVSSIGEEEQMAAKQAVVDFFDAAEKEDYDTMKTYCTEDFQKYFGKDGETEHWFGFENAKLRTISLLADDDGAYMRSWFPEEKSGYLFNIEIKGETVPDSALWSEEKPIQEGLYTLLVQQGDDGWKLAGVTTE